MASAGQRAAVPPDLGPTILSAIVSVEAMAESFGQIGGALASRSDRRAFKAARLAALTLAKRLRDVNRVLAGGGRR